MAGAGEGVIGDTDDDRSSNGNEIQHCTPFDRSGARFGTVRRTVRHAMAHAPELDDPVSASSVGRGML